MRFAALFFLAFSFEIVPVAAQSACSPEEKIVWSCKNQKNTYVVCASGDLSQTSGYLQYRVTKAAKPVLTFPVSRIHPVGIFSFALLARGATLTFENSGYRYQMFEGLEGTPALAVSKDGKHLNTVQCADSHYTLTLTDTINLLQAAGVGK